MFRMAIYVLIYVYMILIYIFIYIYTYKYIYKYIYICCRMQMQGSPSSAPQTLDRSTPSSRMQMQDPRAVCRASSEMGENTAGAPASLRRTSTRSRLTLDPWRRWSCKMWEQSWSCQAPRVFVDSRQSKYLTRSRPCGSRKMRHFFVLGIKY